MDDASLIDVGVADADVKRLLNHAHRIEREGKKEIAEVIYNAASEIARLRAELTWQPMETAPLYREILMYFPRAEIIGNSLLRKDKRHFRPASQQVIVMMKRQTFLRPVTHWMPLPEPPVPGPSKAAPE